MKTFASHADLKPKKISFARLSKNCWAFTAEGDPNSGVTARPIRYTAKRDREMWNSMT